MGSVDDAQLPQCAFCLERGDKRLDPRELPCGHVHCLGCIKQQKKVNNEVKCPTCRNEMDASINIDDLPIEAYRCMKSCDPCLRKKVNMSADDFCITCKMYYCWVHKKLHDELHDDHEVVSSSRHSSHSKSSTSFNKPCHLHPKNSISLGCKVCKLLICTKCLENLTVPCKEGSKHHMASLNKLENGARKNLDKYADMLGSKVADINSVMNMCTQAIAKLDKMIAARNDIIKAKRDEQIEAITQKYKALQKQLEDNSVEVVDTVRKYVETVLMPQKAEIEAQFADIQTYFDKNDKVNAVENEKNIEEKVQVLVAKKIPDLELPSVLEVRARSNTVCQAGLEVYDAHSAAITVENILGFTERDNPLLDIIQAEQQMRWLSQRPDSCGKVSSNEDPGPSQRSPKQSQCRKASQAPSISETCKQYQISNCFVSHVVPSGKDVFVVDSLTPAIHKVNDTGVADRFLPIDQSLTAIGIAADKDFLHVQYMDVKDYIRVIDVYSTDRGQFIKKWDTPGEFGASLALVDGDLVICSKDMLAVYSSVAEHIKDISLGTSCVARRICAVYDDSVIISCYEQHQVSKVNIESGERLWINCDIEKPGSVAADKYGRVYVLVKPNDICILNSNTGSMLRRVSLSTLNNGLVEDIAVSDNDQLIAATTHKCTEVVSGYYSIVNLYDLS